MLLASKPTMTEAISKERKKYEAEESGCTRSARNDRTGGKSDWRTTTGTAMPVGIIGADQVIVTSGCLAESAAGLHPAARLLTVALGDVLGWSGCWPC